MASITSLSNSYSSTSSIYGNRNVLSGLASGMDTESMIENAVAGIKLKIQNLQKKQTKIEWQQEAYRSIIDKAVNFNQKYTSYSSSTNLLSSSFFNRAVITTPKSANADNVEKVSATGKTNSDIKLLGVKQMATAATYRVSGLAGQTGSGAVEGGEVDLNKVLEQSNVSGTLTLKYGSNRTIDLSFDELTCYKDTDELAKGIQKKLGEISVTTSSGESKKASEMVNVQVKNGNIVFSDKQGAGNSVTVSSATGKIKETLGIDSSAKSDTLNVAGKQLVDKSATVGEYLSGKEISVTLDGVTKKITLPEFDRENNKLSAEDYLKEMQSSLDKVFGKGKIEVGGAGEDGKFSLSMKPTQDGSTLSVSGAISETLGLHKNGQSSYLDTGKKLGDLLGKDFDWSKLPKVEAEGEVREVKDKEGKVTHYVDSKGNRVAKSDDSEDGKYYQVDSEGNYLHDFTVNGVSVGKFSKDTALESVITAINSSEAGVKASYSKVTNEFLFTANEMGTAGKIEFGDGLAKGLFGGQEIGGGTYIQSILGADYKGYGKKAFTLNIGDDEITVEAWKGDGTDGKGTTIDMLVRRLNNNEVMKDKGYKVSYDTEKNGLVVEDENGQKVDFNYGEGMAQDLFGKIEKQYTRGQDAIVSMSVNGRELTDVSRSGNTFEVDGLTITLKDTFGYGEDGKLTETARKDAVSFESAADSDKIVDAIKSMVEDYNAMVTELKSAYSTQPASKNNGRTRYEPLTAEQMADMSDREIEQYEALAKQGILFGDSNLSSMYNKLRNAITPGGSDGQVLREIGITTSYSDGLTTLSLDEEKLRTALSNDPEKVRNAFTKTSEDGSGNGLMQNLQSTLETYVKTTGEPKGVLITHAGSVKAPTSLNSNSLLNQINNIDKQIERWENKMSDQIDRYTTQFSKLEQLIAEMNSQASAMSGLMGGTGGY